MVDRLVNNLRTRGGVEDTRLEAKAKDTKKNPRPRPRTVFPRTDTLETKGRNARGQGPRTQAQVLSKKKKSSKTFFRRSPKNKKKGLHKNFSSDLHKKNVFQKIFQALHKILTIQKILLSSSGGQANFRGLEASRPRPRTWHSRPRPRTSKCVLEAKDILENSTSASNCTLQLKLMIRGGVKDTRLEAKDTKKSEAKAKDSASEDRPSRSHGQECSRPRPRTKDTIASVLQKKGLQNFFLGVLR